MRRASGSDTLRKIAATAGFFVLLAVVLAYAGAVVKPGRSVVKGEGGVAWSSFLAQRPDSLDVLFFGNSHIFDGIDPIVLWREKGLTGFVNGGPVQQLSITRYYVREELDHQSPKVVVIEMSSSAYRPERFDREFHLTNVGYMPWSANKLAAAFQATPDGERVGVLFDLWTYHTRWSELTARDFDLTGKNAGGEFMKGYLPKAQWRAVSSTPRSESAIDKTIADATVRHNLIALRDIVKECGEDGVEVLLLLTPTSPPGAYSYFLRTSGEALMADFDNVRMLDLSAPGAVPGLSYEDDFFDGGHLNDVGSAKATAVLARYLSETYGLTGHRSDPAYASWNDDAAKHDAFIGTLRRRPH